MIGEIQACVVPTFQTYFKLNQSADAFQIILKRHVISKNKDKYDNASTIVDNEQSKIQMQPETKETTLFSINKTLKSNRKYNRIVFFALAVSVCPRVVMLFVLSAFILFPAPLLYQR